MRELIRELQERRRKRSSKKDPKSKMGSLQRWLMGAKPAIKSYAKAAQLGAKSHMRDESALGAMQEVATILSSIEKHLERLGELLPAVLKGL